MHVKDGKHNQGNETTDSETQVYLTTSNRKTFSKAFHKRTFLREVY